MRAIAGLLLTGCLVTPPGFTQDVEESRSTVCNVVAGSPDVNAAGEFVRPEPTPEQCERGASLEARFLATPPGDFRAIRDMSRLSGPIRTYVEGIGDDGRVRNPVNVEIGRRYPQSLRPAVMIWLGTELVVIAYRSSDLSGSATNVVLADIDSLTVCSYFRWRGGILPADLTIREVQAALDRNLLGDREAPDCQLRSLPLD